MACAGLPEWIASSKVLTAGQMSGLQHQAAFCTRRNIPSRMYGASGGIASHRRRMITTSG